MEQNQTYEIFDGGFVGPQDNRGAVIWLLALGLGVNTLEVELFPHGLHQLVDIPAVLGADGD